MRIIRRLAVCAGLLCVLSYAAWEASKAPTWQAFGEVVARVETSMPWVAITLDDGPSAAYTETVLALLAQADAPATFFLVGEAATAHPALVARIAEAGHEIGNHSFTHDRMILRARADLAADLSQTDAALRAAGYDGPLHFRAPYGQRGLAISRILDAEQRLSVMWDVSEEAEGDDPATYARRIVDAAEPGSIIVMHVMFRSREVDRAALPLVIEGLRARGLEPVTLSTLLNAG